MPQSMDMDMDTTCRSIGVQVEELPTDCESTMPYYTKLYAEVEEIRKEMQVLKEDRANAVAMMKVHQQQNQQLKDEIYKLR